MSVWKQLLNWAIDAAQDAGKQMALQALQQGGQAILEHIQSPDEGSNALAKDAIKQLKFTLGDAAPDLAPIAKQALLPLSRAIGANKPNDVLEAVTQKVLSTVMSHAVAGVLTRQ